MISTLDKNRPETVKYNGNDGDGERVEMLEWSEEESLKGKVRFGQQTKWNNRPFRDLGEMKFRERKMWIQRHSWELS